jgi:signal peptidase I
LIGDFLFVSKINYGARVPMTTVALPMVHDSIPFVKKILRWPQLPYLRLPAIEEIKRPISWFSTGLLIQFIIF